MKRALLLAGLVAGLFIIVASRLHAQDPLPTQWYIRASLHLVVDAPDGKPTTTPTYVVKVEWAGPYTTRDGALDAARTAATSGLLVGDVLYPPCRVIDMTFIKVE